MWKMTEEAKAKLREIPRKQCSVCNSRQDYTNPACKCYECRLIFCYDHIHSLQVNDKMGENDELRDICEECQKKYGYRIV